MLKNTGVQGSTLSSHCMTTGFGPFELPTHVLLQKGQDHSPRKFCFAQPFGWHSYSYGHLHCYEYSNYYELGVGSMGGVIFILTKGVGERLTYGIPARYRVVLVERLGGLFFDGRRSSAADSFAGRSFYTAASLSW